MKVQRFHVYITFAHDNFLCYMFSEEKIEGEMNEPVEPDKTDVRQDCYSLPAQFQWDTLDVHNPTVVS